MIGTVRRNPSTVVVLAGDLPGTVLAAVGRSLNVVLVRPDGKAGGIEAAAGALRRAAGIAATYVLVAADPLAEVAAEWRAMWEITAETRGSEGFELRAAEALSAWRANRFELPDYYLVLAAQTAAGDKRPGPGHGDAAGTAVAAEPLPDFYLGPLRSVRPHRVTVVPAAEPAEQAAGLLDSLGSLRHGPWWPSLEEVIDVARGFYPGSLAEYPAVPKAAAPLLA
jgi:hypothetical protein